MAAPEGNQYALGNNGGYPSKYNPDLNETVTNYCLLGCTDLELAKFLGISEKTFYTWKNKHKEFSQAIQDGKEIADANVGKALYQRAVGYSHDEEKIFNYEGAIVTHDTIKHYPPEVKACIHWLKNRQKAKWRDDKGLELSGSVTIDEAIRLRHKEQEKS